VYTGVRSAASLEPMHAAALSIKPPPLPQTHELNTATEDWSHFDDVAAEFKQDCAPVGYSEKSATAATVGRRRRANGNNNLKEPEKPRLGDFVMIFPMFSLTGFWSDSRSSRMVYCYVHSFEMVACTQIGMMQE